VISSLRPEVADHREFILDWSACHRYPESNDRGGCTRHLAKRARQSWARPSIPRSATTSPDA